MREVLLCGAAEESEINKKVHLHQYSPFYHSCCDFFKHKTIEGDEEG
jgi:hypothetical protein